MMDSEKSCHCTAEVKHGKRFRVTIKSIKGKRMQCSKNKVWWRLCTEILWRSELLGRNFWRSPEYWVFVICCPCNWREKKDLLRAKAVGLEKSSTFISERIRSNNIPFYDPMKKNNLKTFSSMSAKKKVKIGDKHVLIKADREFFCRMLILQEKRGIS